MHSRNARTTESLNFLIFIFCNNCLFVEVSDKEIFDFLTSNSCFYIFVNGGSMMTNSLKSTDVGETHDISFEAPFTLRLAGHIDMLFFQCFVCNLWFLFIVRVNVVSCRVTL